jgi:phosphoglycerol geranylgeranyltransferase
MRRKAISPIITTAKAHSKKLLAVLIDPDKLEEHALINLVQEANTAAADLIFIGGSLITGTGLDTCIETVKEHSEIPVILFPGSIMQVSPKADAILYMSLISGRNPDLLIGNQVISAPYIKQINLETLSTGYMLVDCGQSTTAIYMSGSAPLPYNKPEIAACTAMAGDMLGLSQFYLDGGSGADKTVNPEIIKAVRAAVDKPIIVGGGIRNAAQAKLICEAGADVIVIGNVTEENPAIIKEIANTIHSF